MAALLALAWSCSPGGALTPGDAFQSLAAAYKDRDADALHKLLSDGSRQKIWKVTMMFSRMDAGQLRTLSMVYGVPEEKLRKMTVKDYCSLLLKKGLSGNVIMEAASRKMVGVRKEGKRATVRVDNGMELYFIKEGPYWKFDMGEL
jgi:hypothetical protein